MPIEIASIGVLVGAAKALVETIKGIRDLGSGQTPSDEQANQFDKVEVAFKEYQKRIEYLSEQLHQAESLRRMLPIWLKVHSEFQIWEESPDDETIKNLDFGLRQFISDSIRDQFSSVFFKDNFDKLPGVTEKIEKIREQIQQLEKEINSIPHSNLPAWRVHLSTIKVRLSDLRNLASEIDSHVDHLHGELINELKQAAAIRT